jgi:putative multicomponent Na+:H+ antiporter subunit B
MNVVFEPSKLNHSKEDYQFLFSSKTLAGSPHAILDAEELCIESPILLEELLETSFYKQNQFIELICSHNILSKATSEEIK